MPAILDLWADLAGVMWPYAGNTPPAGWLLCDGRAVSRTTYKNLFDKIGTSWGAGDGATTFNVPDLRGRVLAGKDNMGGTAAGRLTNTGTGHSGINGNQLGAVGGADRHTLSAAEMPQHAHGPQLGAANIYGNRSDGGIGASTGSDLPNGVSAWSSTGNAGSSQAHPNVQPTAVANWMIRT